MPLGIARSFDHPQQRLPNGFYAGETKGAPFEPAQPVRSEEGSVDQRRIRIVTTSCADRPVSSSLRKAMPTMLGNWGDGTGIGKHC